MALKDAFRAVTREQSPFGLVQPERSFLQTQPGDPEFSLAATPSSQVQFPAAAAEKGGYDISTRATNQLANAQNFGVNIDEPVYEPLQTAADQGFLPRALTLGEKLIGWVDGPRQAVNLLVQDILGGVAEEGLRDPTFGDYWNTLWGGMEDSEGFKFATGLEPRSGSKTLDMFGWSEEETLLGRIGRGVVDFGLQVVTDPLTYFTFGLSMLGKNVARATGTKFMDDVIAKVVPAFDTKTNKAGEFLLTDSYLQTLKASDSYTYNLVREIMGSTDDNFITQFQDDMLEKIEAHGGTLPPEIARAMKNRIGHEEQWFDHLVELAVANRVTKDVIQPLMAKDFANIDKLALEQLPKWAYGGARIAVPFTQSSLTQGFLIPGTQGLGKRLVGDPVRKFADRMVKFGHLQGITKNVDESLLFFDTERAMNRALAQGKWKGWQYVIAKRSLDNIASQAGREQIMASLNVLGTRTLEAADQAGVEDMSIVWSKVMHLLEGYDSSMDDMALQALDDITGGSLRNADAAGVEDFADDLLADGNLMGSVEELATFLRETFDNYHKALSQFNPDVKKKYIDNYAPHALTPEGRQILGTFSRLGKGVGKKEWQSAQAGGDPGGVLLAHLINTVGRGGRLESSMGSSKYFNPRDEGKFAVLALTDDGDMLVAKDFWQGLTDSAAPVISEGGAINPTLKTKYAPSSQMNSWLKPWIERIAEENNIHLPKDWEGKLFSEDPLELAASYIRNLDEVVRVWNAVDGLKAAGLAFNHDTAPDVHQVINNMHANMVRNSEKVTATQAGKPKKGTAQAPVEWVLRTVQPDNLKSAATEREVIDRIKRDMQEHGFNPKRAIPIGIDENGRAAMMDGHHRLIAAQELGIEEIPVKFEDSAGLDFTELSEGIDVSDFLKKEPKLKDEIQTPEEIAAREIAAETKDFEPVYDFITARRADAIDVFDMLPWKPRVKEGTRILKGYQDIMGPIRTAISGPLRRMGWNSDDMSGNARIFQLAKMSEEDFLALRENPMKADGALVDKATGGYQNLRRVSGRMELNTINKGQRGWTVTNLHEGRDVYTFRDKAGKPRGDIVVTKDPDGMDVDFTVNPNLSPRQQLAFSRDLIEKFDEMVTTGPLKGQFTFENLERVLKTNNMSDAGARMMRLYLRSKVRQLPEEVVEELAKEPSEFMNTRMLADEFIDEMNLFFKEYAQLYDPNTGRLVLDPNRIAIGGDDVIRQRIKSLRDAARLADEAGWDTAVKIMSKIDDPMGLAQVDDFVNPQRFALGGPALESLSLQREAAMWLRNYARNVATAYTPEGIAAASMAARTSLRWWKAMATIARPAFHIRNHVSATWANMTIGVRPKDYAMVRDNAIVFKKALREGATPEEAVSKLSKEAQPYFQAAWDNDIMSGFVSSELRTLTAAQKRERISWAKVTDVDNFVLTRVGGHVMESIEDFHRMAAFVRWYDPATPNTVDVAKSMVERVHFNYAKTTPLEDRVKSFVPFFVWTRRNIPLQMSTLIENPRFIQRYRAMMQSLNDNFSSKDENGLPIGDNFSAYAAGTDYYVNPGTPFWARVVIDPDLPIRDLLDLPNPSPHGLLDFGKQLLGPHLSTILSLNEQREFGDVNAPAPLNAVIKSLAFVGLYDETADGDVRIPYWARTVAETALPPGRELIDPITGGPSDPNRQQRLGISQDDSFLERSLKTLGGTAARALGVKLNTPVDVRSANARTQAELDQLIKDLRLQGKLPPSERGSSDELDLAELVFG